MAGKTSQTAPARIAIVGGYADAGRTIVVGGFQTRGGRVVTDVWTWSGRYFGYLDGEDLWARDGRHIGRCRGDAIFDPDGSYLGEIAFNNRLRVARADRLFRIDPFPRMDNRAPLIPLMDRMPYTLIGGYEDFPR